MGRLREHGRKAKGGRGGCGCSGELELLNAGDIQPAGVGDASNPKSGEDDLGLLPDIEIKSAEFGMSASTSPNC